MKSLSELHRDISGPLNNLEINRLHDLQRNIAELVNALENSDQRFKPEDLAQVRLRLAATALRLSQKTIPTLNELADELLQIAGGEAIRAACSPIQRIDAPPLPSDYKLPKEWQPSTVSGIAQGAMAAFALMVSPFLK